MLRRLLPVPVMHPVRLPPSIHLLEHDWLSANSVVCLDDPDSASVIDTGHVVRCRQTCDGVRAALQGRRLLRIVNTHLHSDHCGGNSALQQEHGGPAQCAIVVPAGELQAVNDWDESGLSFVQTGQQAQSFRAASSYADGDVLQLAGMAWQVHAAAGHDNHALMLFQPEARLLISGDALWRYGFGVLFPELDGSGEGFAGQRRTLRRMQELRPAAVIPGHGAAFDDVDAALARAHARLDLFEADPRRHAWHALRVLLKFHLLEQESMVPLSQLRQWFVSTSLVRATVRNHGQGVDAEQAFAECLEALLAGGAAVQRGAFVGDPQADAAESA